MRKVADKFFSNSLRREELLHPLSSLPPPATHCVEILYSSFSPQGEELSLRMTGCHDLQTGIYIIVEMLIKFRYRRQCWSLVSRNSRVLCISEW